MLQVRRPSPWTGLLSSAAVVTFVMGAAAASFDWGWIATALGWLGLAEVAAALAVTLLGVGGSQQAQLDEERLVLDDIVFPRQDVMGVEVVGRDLVLVLRQGIRLHTRQTVRFHHAPQILLTLHKALLAEVLTDLAQPDEGPRPEEARRLHRLRETQ